MRHLTTRTAALALGIDVKALDNILAREARSLLTTGRRGKGRRIDFATLERIAVALVLNRDLGSPVAKSLELANEVLQSTRGRDSEVSLSALTVLRFDTAHLRRALESAVADALEEFVPPRRGRTPRPPAPEPASA